MKLPLLLLLLLSILLLSSSASLLSTAQYALDINGDPLEKGTKYYILQTPIMPGSGGVTLVKLNESEICPLYVGLRPLPFFLPVKFENANPSAPGGEYVSLNERNRVSFSDPPPCVRLPAWWREIPGPNGEYLSVAFGYTGLKDELNGWYEVRSSDQPGQYRLAACRCLPCFNICPEVALVEEENGNRVLGIFGSAPLTVAFSKAETFDYIRQYPSKLSY